MNPTLVEIGADGPAQPELTPRKRKVGLFLRSRQVDYLNSVAEREGAAPSRVLGCIIEAYIDEASPPKVAVTKARRKFSLEPDHLALLDAVARKWGLPRSDVVRRLVDRAQSENLWIEMV